MEPIDTSSDSFSDELKKLKEADKIDLTVYAAKFATTHVIHHCVAAVAVVIVKNLAPSTTKKEKIQVYIAARAMSGMVADGAAKRISDKMDRIEAFVNQDVLKRWKKPEPPSDILLEKVPVSGETPT